MFGKNFDIEDRISATEGESIVMGSFGAYGDEMEMGDEADFGNIGFADYEENMGEVDSHEIKSLGDFGDDDGMGFRPRQAFNRATRIDKNKIQSQARASFNRATRINHTKMRLPVQLPALAAPIMRTQQALLTRAVGAFRHKNKNRIAAIQQNAINSGRPVPSVIELIPATQRAAMVQEETVKAMDSVQPSHSRPSVSPAVSDGAVVVATAGSKLNQSDVVSTSSKVLNISSSNSQYAHPMLAAMQLPSAMNGMGFDFNAFLADAKAKAAAALKQAQADVVAKVQQAGGNLFSSIGQRAIADPKVQAMVVQEAKAAAASSLAEKLLDPANQALAKKAALGTGATVAIAAAAYFAWKAMKK